MTCQRCNGIGYTNIRNGDDDLPCPECGGTGEQPTYYLANPLLSFRLPFPLTSRSAAEAHNSSLGGGYTVIECGERVGEVDEMAEYEASVEREIEIEANKYGGM